MTWRPPTGDAEGPGTGAGEDRETRASASDVTSRIAQVLAAAEQEVREIAASDAAEADDLRAREEALQERILELDARGAALDERSTELTRREAALDARASLLTDITAELLNTALGAQAAARRLEALKVATSPTGGPPHLDDAPPSSPVSLVPEPVRGPVRVPVTFAEASTVDATGTENRDRAGAGDRDAADDGPADGPWAAQEPWSADGPTFVDEQPEGDRPAAARGLSAVDERSSGGERPPADARPDASSAFPDDGTADEPSADSASSAAGPDGPPALRSTDGPDPERRPGSSVPGPPSGPSSSVPPSSAAGARPWTTPAGASEREIGRRSSPRTRRAWEAERPSDRPGRDTAAAGPDAAPTVRDAPEAYDRARLVALTMAAEGHGRDAVEAHLRDELGIAGHAALIEYVFGGSTPSSVVPAWPPRRRGGR
ncbi:unannotated protein [freshwater metagenome]|uniref:Unannotated protein n=1 Tax=freshwater metagenome TaxID=449393 RepID=A0A6J7FJC5_9ZZZZ|nr:hypothetical protein [Actinomycetota bacterium]